MSEPPLVLFARKIHQDHAKHGGRRETTVSSYDEVIKWRDQFCARDNGWAFASSWDPTSKCYRITYEYKRDSNFKLLWSADTPPYAQPLYVWCNVFYTALRAGYDDLSKFPLRESASPPGLMRLSTFLALHFTSFFEDIRLAPLRQLLEVPQMPVIHDTLYRFWDELRNCLKDEDRQIVANLFDKGIVMSPKPTIEYANSHLHNPSFGIILADFMKDEKKRKLWTAYDEQFKAYKKKCADVELANEQIAKDNERLSNKTLMDKCNHVKHVLTGLLIKWFFPATPEELKEVLDQRFPVSESCPDEHEWQQQQQQQHMALRQSGVSAKSVFANNKDLVTDGSMFLTTQNPVFDVTAFTLQSDYGYDEQIADLKNQLVELKSALNSKGDTIIKDTIKDLSKGIEKLKEVGGGKDGEVFKMMKDMVEMYRKQMADGKGGQSLEMKLLLNKIDEFSRELNSVRDDSYKDGMRRLQDQIKNSAKPGEEMKEMLAMFKQITGSFKDLLSHSNKGSTTDNEMKLLMDKIRSLEGRFKTESAPLETQMKMLRDQVGKPDAAAQAQIKALEQQIKVLMENNRTMEERLKSLNAPLETQIKMLQTQAGKPDPAVDARLKLGEDRQKVLLDAISALERRLQTAAASSAQDVNALRQERGRPDASVEARFKAQEDRNRLILETVAALQKQLNLKKES